MWPSNGEMIGVGAEGFSAGVEISFIGEYTLAGTTTSPYNGTKGPVRIITRWKRSV